ncbi:MAG: GNAT family N-acetyltransferase [Anaerolineae bacterium]|nr:GNAT family N-acetyltransferase [Anaerolineae bacterium]
MQIETLDADGARTLFPDLVALLRDSVDHGASVGFLPPLADAEAHAYWDKAISDLAAGERVLVVALDDGRVVGGGQLALEARPNGRHRADIQKVLVRTDYRRRGIAQTLMLALEDAARAHQRSLLVLDTVQGGDAERLYARLGYTRAGVIPDFALNGDGGRDATVVFYKLL